MSQPSVSMCTYCKVKDLSIPRGLFNKQLAFCSEYCKSKYELQYGLLWMFIAAIVFGGFESSTPNQSVHPISRLSFIIF